VRGFGMKREWRDNDGKRAFGEREREGRDAYERKPWGSRSEGRSYGDRPSRSVERDEEGYQKPAFRSWENSGGGSRDRGYMGRRSRSYAEKNGRGEGRRARSWDE